MHRKIKDIQRRAPGNSLKGNLSANRGGIGPNGGRTETAIPNYMVGNAIRGCGVIKIILWRAVCVRVRGGLTPSHSTRTSPEYLEHAWHGRGWHCFNGEQTKVYRFRDTCCLYLDGCPPKKSLARPKTIINKRRKY